MSLSSDLLVRILIADDHLYFRKTLIQLIAAEGQFQVVAEARSGREAIELARQVNPDVIIMDVEMPEMDGLQAARIIHREGQRARIILLTVCGAEESRFFTEIPGVYRCLSKTVDQEIILETIHRAYRNP